MRLLLTRFVQVDKNEAKFYYHRIEAKILKSYDAVIKYAPFSDPEGEPLFISKDKILTILYEDGVVETFNTDNTKNADNVNNIDNAKSNVTNNKTTPVPSTEKTFYNVVKFKPFATIYALIYGSIEVDIQYTRYLTPKVGIPVEVGLLGKTLCILCG
jgi:hypothetical protein